MAAPRTLLAALALAVASPAIAQDINTPYSGKRAKTLEVHAGFAWYGYGAAFGARLGIPILHNGFVSSINNSLNLSVGFDIYNAEYRFREDRRRGYAVGVPVALQWNLYFSNEWSMFLSAGINAYFDGDDPRFGYNWGIASIGGRYHFNDDIALLLRVGSPYSSIGIDISL